VKPIKQKRIKQVFASSSQVYHLWANQSQAYARQGGRITRSFFQNESAYSYGRHYEVGRIVTYKGIKVGIVNNKGYSPTTGKHISEAYDALQGLMPRIKATTFDVRGALLENQDRLVEMLMHKFSERRFWKDYKFGDDERWDTREIKEFNKLCDTLKHPELKLEVTQDFIDLINAHAMRCVARALELASPENEAKREAQREVKKLKEMEKNRESVEAWKQGGTSTQFIRQMRPMLIRIKGNVVETSGGAEVPLTDARRLLRDIETSNALPSTKIGQFTFDSFDGKIVKIGCHAFNFDDAKAVLSNTHLKLVS
jgi:hypothetical protein